MCHSLNFHYEGSNYLHSSCYQTYCLPDGKMVINIVNVNFTCDYSRQILNFGAN